MIDIVSIANEIDGCGNEFSQAEAILAVLFHSGRRGTEAIEPLRRLMVVRLIEAVWRSAALSSFQARSLGNAR